MDDGRADFKRKGVFKQKLESVGLTTTISTPKAQKLNTILRTRCPSHQLFIVLSHALLGGTPSHRNDP